MAVPSDARRVLGFALSRDQVGDQHDAVRGLRGFWSAGMLEAVENDGEGFIVPSHREI